MPGVLGLLAFEQLFFHEWQDIAGRDLALLRGGGDGIEEDGRTVGIRSRSGAVSGKLLRHVTYRMHVDEILNSDTGNSVAVVGPLGTVSFLGLAVASALVPAGARCALAFVVSLSGG